MTKKYLKYKSGPMAGQDSAIVRVLKFDAAPAYLYKYSVPPCGNALAPAKPAWINLDETSQIALNFMFAGSGQETTKNNSSPQLFRFWPRPIGLTLITSRKTTFTAKAPINKRMHRLFTVGST